MRQSEILNRTALSFEEESQQSATQLLFTCPAREVKVQLWQILKNAKEVGSPSAQRQAKMRQKKKQQQRKHTQHNQCGSSDP